MAKDEKSAALLRAAAEGPEERLPAVIAEANAWLEDQDPERRRGALEVLGHAACFRGHRPAPEVLRKIAACARDGDPEVRAESACALSLIPNAPDAERASLLLALIDDENGHVREEAAAAIGDLRLSAGADALARHLERDEHESVRVECAIALGALKDARAVEALIGALDRPWDRIYVLRALADIGDPRAIPPLARLGKKRFGSFHERLHALGALYRLGERWAGEKILERARAWNRAERELALWMLGHARVLEGVELLLAIARDRRHDLREAAMRGLGVLDEPAAARALVEIARDEETASAVRVAAVDALAEVESEGRRRALEEVASSAGGEVASAAREKLG